MRRVYVFLLALISTCGFAQNGTPQAIYERSLDAITGTGLSRNDFKGIDLFRQSANLDYAPAQVALAYYYDTGTVIAGNQAEALDLYRRAAQQGDPLATWLVGRCYFLRTGGKKRLSPTATI